MGKKIKKILFIAMCIVMVAGIIIYFVAMLSHSSRTDRSIVFSTEQIVAVADRSGAIRIDDPGVFEHAIYDMWDNTENGEYSYYIELNDYNTRCLTYDLFFASHRHAELYNPYFPVSTDKHMDDAVIYISFTRDNNNYELYHYWFVSAVAVDYGSTLTTSQLFTNMSHHIIRNYVRTRSGIDYVVFCNQSTIYGIYREGSTIYYICGSCLPICHGEIYSEDLNDLCEQLGIKSPLDYLNP